MIRASHYVIYREDYDITATLVNPDVSNYRYSLSIVGKMQLNIEQENKEIIS